MPAPSHAETQTGTVGAADNVVSAALGAGGADSLYLAFVLTRSDRDVTGVSGLGLTWTEQAEQCGARSQTGIRLWTAYGAGSAGAVTATFASSTSSSIISVSRYTGVDLSTPTPTIVRQNTLGVDGACSGGTDDNDVDGSITVAGSDSMVVAGFNTRNGTVTGTIPTTGWTSRVTNLIAGIAGEATRCTVEEIAPGASGSLAFGQVDWLSGDVDHAEIVVEIKAAGGAAVPNALMMMGAGA